MPNHIAALLMFSLMSIGIIFCAILLYERGMLNDYITSLAEYRILLGGINDNLKTCIDEKVRERQEFYDPLSEYNKKITKAFDGGFDKYLFSDLRTELEAKLIKHGSDWDRLIEGGTKNLVDCSLLIAQCESRIDNNMYRKIVTKYKFLCLHEYEPHSEESVDVTWNGKKCKYCGNLVGHTEPKVD